MQLNSGMYIIACVVVFCFCMAVHRKKQIKAVLFIFPALLLLGCGNEHVYKETEQALKDISAPSDKTEEPVSLKLVKYGDASGRRREFFEKEFHERILEELNIDLTVEFVSWEAQQSLAARMASGEGFACMNVLSRNDWVSRGYLAGIEEEQMKNLCPNLLHARGKNGLECVTVDGMIYAIPLGGKSYAGDLQYFDIRADLIKELGYQPQEITSLEKLEEVMAACKAAYPDLRILSRADEFLMTALASELSDRLFLPASENNFAVVDEREEGAEVYSYYETEEFKKLCEITKRWAKFRYIQEDELTNPDLEDADWDAGKCLLRSGVTGAMVSTALKERVPGAEEALVKIGSLPNYKFKDYDWAISISKADAEKVPYWLCLFDWIYEKQEHYNFCVYGVEGKDYEYQDGRIVKFSSEVFFNEWLISAFGYKQYDPSVSEEKIQEYENFDGNSRFSKIAGFFFDSTPVSSELARLNVIYEEKLKPMIFGFLDYDQYYEEVLQELKEAGLDRYIREYQKQFLTWYESK